MLDKTFVLVGTLCLAGNQYKVPSVEFWQSIMQDRGYLVVVFLGIVGIFGAFAPFSSWAALMQVEQVSDLADSDAVKLRQIDRAGSEVEPGP